jgi:ankyrin repeat protein
MKIAVLVVSSLFWLPITAASSFLNALATNDPSIISSAISAVHSSELNLRDSQGRTPLMSASLSGRENSVQALLNANADVNIGEENGYTPLHGAGFQGRASVSKILLLHGVMNTQHSDGYTAFHRACWGSEERHAHTVHVFLSVGNVDPDLPARNGKTCLQMTPNESTKEVVTEWKTYLADRAATQTSKINHQEL